MLRKIDVNCFRYSTFCLCVAITYLPTRTFKSKKFNSLNGRNMKDCSKCIRNVFTTKDR